MRSTFASFDDVVHVGIFRLTAAMTVLVDKNASAFISVVHDVTRISGDASRDKDSRDPRRDEFVHEEPLAELQAAAIPRV